MRKQKQSSLLSYQRVYIRIMIQEWYMWTINSVGTSSLLLAQLINDTQLLELVLQLTNLRPYCIAGQQNTQKSRVKAFFFPDLKTAEGEEPVLVNYLSLSLNISTALETFETFKDQVLNTYLNFVWKWSLSYILFSLKTIIDIFLCKSNTLLVKM